MKWIKKESLKNGNRKNFFFIYISTFFILDESFIYSKRSDYHIDILCEVRANKVASLMAGSNYSSFYYRSLGLKLPLPKERIIKKASRFTVYTIHLISKHK